MGDSEDLNYVINILMSTYLIVLKSQLSSTIHNQECVDELASAISDAAFDSARLALASSFTADEISDIAEYNRKYHRHIQSLANNISSLVRAKLETEEYAKKLESVMNKYQGGV